MKQIRMQLFIISCGILIGTLRATEEPTLKTCSVARITKQQLKALSKELDAIEHILKTPDSLSLEELYRLLKQLKTMRKIEWDKQYRNYTYAARIDKMLDTVDSIIDRRKS